MDNSLVARQLTWLHVAVVVCATMILGSVVAAWEPLWLKPPSFYNTDNLYAVLPLLWIPVLFFLGRRHPQGGRWIPVAVMLLGIGPIIMAGGMFVRATLTGAMVPSCTTQQNAQNVLHYSCKAAFFGDSAVTWEFEGTDALPFVRLLERGTCQNRGCQ